MTAGREMICDHCRKAVPISEIKYLPQGREGRVALCNACRSDRTIARQAANVKEQAGPQKMKFVCTRCSYKFEFSPTRLSRPRCPYCGGWDKVHSCDKLDADSIVRTS